VAGHRALAWDRQGHQHDYESKERRPASDRTAQA
jgi:hypothetical protein